MEKSIIQDNTDECFICKTNQNLHWHHVMNGPFRKKSDKYKLIIRLCARCHEMVHTCQALDNVIKQIGQKEFTKLYGEDKWMEEFRKNYEI